MNRSMDKLGYIHTVNNKIQQLMNELLIHATTWMNLKKRLG